MKRIFVILVIGVVAIACNNSQKSVTRKVGDETVSQISEEDKEMNEAMAKAVSSFNEFKKVYRDSKENGNDHFFSVKIGFPSEMSGKEHMWVGDLQLNGDTFTGILDNEPLDKNIGYKYGDTVIVDPQLVSDWLYIDAQTGLAHGGYTFKVIRSRMSPEERAAFDEQSGLKFE